MSSLLSFDVLDDDNASRIAFTPASPRFASRMSRVSKLVCLLKADAISGPACLLKLQSFRSTNFRLLSVFSAYIQYNIEMIFDEIEIEIEIEI